MKHLTSIDNYLDLFEDMRQYMRQFPETHTRFSTILAVVRQHAEDPIGTTFGVEVAHDWKDKCYGFEVGSTKGDITFIHYVGIWKT